LFRNVECVPRRARIARNYIPQRALIFFINSELDRVFILIYDLSETVSEPCTFYATQFPSPALSRKTDRKFVGILNKYAYLSFNIVECG
jgi:hypothetical protein